MTELLIKGKNGHADASLAKNRLLTDCYQYMLADELPLPTLPDLSLRIRRALDSYSGNSYKMAKILQNDPVVTAKLIKVSNSALYKGQHSIQSCPEAITRIGLEAVANMVTAFTLKSAFEASSPVITRLMADKWSHSTEVAATCAVIAKKAHGFDPDKAMLAGLIHDIGVLPILKISDLFPDIINHLDYLHETISHLRGEIGAQILSKWNFPDEFKDVAIHADDWYRDHEGKPDYTDIVIIAQLHQTIRKAHVEKTPKMDTLPAYHKLFGKHFDAEFSMSIFNSAKDEIAYLQALLN